MPTDAGAAAMASGKGPITDTHIHFWDIARQIPWPSEDFGKLYRTVLPADYKAIAAPAGVTASGIVEASSRFEDQLWVLEQVEGDDFFTFYAAMLEIGADDFVGKLDRLAERPLVVGIRGFLWAPELKVDARQVEHCTALAKRGMTLDVISRGTLNPKALVIRLAKSVPELRIVIDHLGGAKGERPDPAWVMDMQRLARCANVHVKFSSFFDMFNPNDSEEQEWDSPDDLDRYAPHFDVLMDAFGPDRLIWGSNWPVVEMSGTLEKQIALAEKYLAPMGQSVRDRVMSENGLRFYSRKA